MRLRGARGAPAPRRGLLSLAALAFVAAACAPPPSAPPKAPPAPPPTPPPDLADGPLGAYRSDRFDLIVPLPDARGWRIDDDKEPWLVATHAATSTSLLVRVWREDNRASRASCEARARLFRDLPRREGSMLVDRRAIDVPEGFDTVVELGASAAAPGAPIDGFAMAFGGWARRCFAFVATTRAAGAHAEELVADRLAAMVEVSLRGLRLTSDLAPEIPREPRP